MNTLPTTSKSAAAIKLVEILGNDDHHYSFA
jgi:hypothetical protein